MCGIAGIIDLSGKPVEISLIRAMTDSIAHRGPDGEGHWVEGPVGIGHRRLAIIDTSNAASQPMVSASGRFVLSYNGEVYNFRELRRELEQLGAVFRTTSDAEVVLEGLALWGTRAISRFNGMFALALWDRSDRKLILARDRYGIKPLYWRKTPTCVAFASEVKSLNSIATTKPIMDYEALHEYLTFQNIFSERTLFKDIELLPPGFVMEVNASTNGGAITKSRYWDFDFHERSSTTSDAEYQEELKRLLISAVERQLVSDVEVGAYLSGGIDSGTLVAVAARQIPDLKSFTLGFDLSSASGLELGFDERQAAEELSANFGTEHYEMVLKAGDMERCMTDLIWHLEDLRVGQSYPNFYAAKLASRFVKVVLAGTGGDELFGGYPWRYFHSPHTANQHDFSESYFQFWQRLLSDDERARLLRPISKEVPRSTPKEIFQGILKQGGIDHSSSEGQVNTSLYLESKTFLHGLLLVDDKLSMAHGLENRVPFLDNDLVDFAMSCPSRLKVLSPSRSVLIDENLPGSKKAVFQITSNDGKRILRSVAQDFMPHHLVEARKQGFSAPDSSWYRGQSIDYVRRQLLGTNSNIAAIMDGRFVQELVEEHLSGRKNRRLLIWSLLSLDSWMESFL